MKKSYKVGRRLEYLLKKELEKQGYLVIRSAGSHSPFDLIALNPTTNEIRFIQVKKMDKYTTQLTREFRQTMNKVFFGKPSIPASLTPYFELYIRDRRKWKVYSYEEVV